VPDLPDWTTAPVALFQPTAKAFVNVSELGDAGVLFTNTTGRDLVITQVQFAAASSTTKRIRGLVNLDLGWGGAPPATVVAFGTISPGLPMAAPQLDPSAAVVPAGQDITWAGVTESGAGVCAVQISATYYLGS